MTDHPAAAGFDLERLAERLGEAPPAPLAMPVQRLDAVPATGRRLPPPGRRVVWLRAAALGFSLAAAAAAFLLFLSFGLADGLIALDVARAVLILLTTWWLAWGAAQAGVGLLSRPAAPPRDAGPVTAATVVLVPVHHEDAAAVFARVAAMHEGLAATGWGERFAIAVLSDSRDPAVLAAERAAFLHCLRETGAEGRLFWRRRGDNRGRKAGNVADFLTRHGAAWDFAIVLDADSLMDGETMVEMVRRMQADPGLGLLQTLPRLVRGRSLFARAMQFSAGLFGPVYARGLAAMQGSCGPFWGHNAIFRIRAFADSCGLPELPGPPPFGGGILSHDYVEAALLARAGWRVRLDPDLGGSFEEGPATLVDHARRDRRWAQGNLQHARLLATAGLAPWHRFTFVQGIFAYLAPLFWLAFLAASIAAAVLAPPPDFFAPGNPVPVFPIDATAQAVALFAGIFGLLFLPKVLIAAAAVVSGRAAAFGGAPRLAGATLAEIALSSAVAPLLLMYQTRAVLQILAGRDGGWPAQPRDGGSLSLAEAWAATRWIALAGGGALAVTAGLAPALAAWLLPVLGPMLLAAPVLWLLSMPAPRSFATPEECRPPAVLRRFTRRLGDGAAADAAGPGPDRVPPLRLAHGA
jgi:membrane glycosyltransferase